MDAVEKILTAAGYALTHFHEPTNPRPGDPPMPVFERTAGGVTERCLVGPMFVVFWAAGKFGVEDMRSVHRDHRDDLRRTAGGRGKAA